MCGITGVYNYGASDAVSRELLDRMNGRIRHRGPDDEGYAVDGRVGLAMSRLAIIDLSGGHQPMTAKAGPERVRESWVLPAAQEPVIVFNGEIYNFLELRRELEAQGRRLRTHSDTEVILHLYDLMGPDCVKKLRGMFAFAIWDPGAERLLLARDRLGKKPLLYAVKDGRFAFASELRCLLELPWVAREVDLAALDLYLSLQYIPAPHTIFKSVEKLPPGHLLLVEKGKIEARRYWDLPRGPGPKWKLADAKAAIREKLTESTRLRMISEVPLGAFLSGGIDSSIVVALMAGLSERPVKTFAIGFDEAEFSELAYARQVAERYGTQHTEFIVKPEMADTLPKIAWHYGEPYADPSALPSYYVARETRKHVTVALNGDGGDENFAGYLRYLAMQAARVWDVLPGPLRNLALAGSHYLPDKNAPYAFPWRLKRFLHSVAQAELPARHLRMIGYFMEPDKDLIYSQALDARLGHHRNAALGYMAQVFARSEGLDYVNRMLYADFTTYLPECLLVKMDIATMACSLEGRSPFLDHEFVELVFGMPGDWKLRGWKLKWLLKETFKDLLPPAIYTRHKQGFGLPLSPWFRGSLKGYWEEHVLSPRALSRGYFQEPGLRALLNEHQTGKRDHSYRLWALLMLELWHEQYLPDFKLS